MKARKKTWIIEVISLEKNSLTDCQKYAVMEWAEN